ncbi:acyl-CoA synthetase [Streptomyces prunicolor]|uniref:acyl-CoA synthetase n=1 Tax=Streptomyces prunicolor TaxID=67348 RepID=UPI003870596D|nr:acyl-CoA synthetase [Streptomyces prunicolor]
MGLPVTYTPSDETLLWPECVKPRDTQDIESLPLERRGLPTSTYAAVRRAAAKWPHRRAITVLHDARDLAAAPSWTFAEIFERTNGIASALVTAGVDRGSAVGLLSPNVAELITAILAAEAVGIAAPANPALSEAHLIDLFRRSGVRVLIAAGPEIDPTVWSTARSLAVGLGLSALYALRPTVPGGAAPDLGVVDGVDVRYLADAAAAHAGGAVAVPEPEATDLAAMFHTGGTTGTPKLAAHTHANEVANAWMAAVNGPLDEESVLFAALPLFHVNALVVTLLGPLLRGQSVVWAGPLGYRDPVMLCRIWKIIERYRIATLSGVPTVYSVLSGIPVDADISSLRFGVVGASPLPPAIEAAFTAHTGVPLLEGYGLSEATCASARNFLGFPRPGAVGQRVPYQQIKTVEIDGTTGEWHDLPPGRPGVVAMNGPAVFAGYVVGRDHRGPVLDYLGKVKDGWLDTGDLGHVDEEGYLYLTGRAKDLIIRGGHNIDPAVIENALLGHPDVTGANAVGRPDAHAGEVPAVYVTVRDGASVSAADLRAFAAEAVPEAASAPKYVMVLDALPVTAVGKPYKVALRMDAMEDAAREALREAGIAASVWCEEADGRLTVSVATAHSAAEVEAVLNRFTFPWVISP